MTMTINNPRYPDAVYIEKLVNVGSSSSPVFVTYRTVDTTCRIELNRTFINNNVLISKYTLRMAKVGVDAKIRIGVDKIFATIYDGKIEGEIISIEHTNFQTILWFNGDYVDAFTPPVNDELTPSASTIQSATSVTETSATLNGTITAIGNTLITQHGFVYSSVNAVPTLTNATVINKGDISYSISAPVVISNNISGLSDNTTYYVRVFSTNYYGTVYSNVATFTTEETIIPAVPVVTTEASTSLIPTGATFNGTTVSSTGLSVTAHGFVWSATEAVPTLSNATVIDLGAQSTLGSFYSAWTGGTDLTTYYVRAFATNSLGTSYGSVDSFETTSSATAPALSTGAATSVTDVSSTLNGTSTSTGGAAITAHGFVWSATETTPTLANATVVNLGAQSTVGAFNSGLTGLTQSTTYYVRAYATNSVGTTYGSTVSFATSATAVAPSLTTSAATSITTSGATFNGETTATGGASITAHGFVWSATETVPTLANATEIALGAQSTIGAFNTVFAGGSTSTLYYVRAYATNSAGTSYGSAVSFTTSAGETVIYETITPEVIEVGYESASIDLVFASAGTYHLRVYGTGDEADLAAAEIIVWNNNSSDPVFYLDAYGLNGGYMDLVIPSAMTAVFKVGNYYPTAAITITAVKIIA